MRVCVFLKHSDCEREMKNEETCSNTESIIPILKLKYKILSMIADQPIGKQLNKSLVLY